MVDCRTVSSRRELDEWIGLTDPIYAETPQFVPPLAQQLSDFHTGKAPHLRHGQIEFLSFVRDGTVVARTTAHTSSKLDAKLGERHLLFGFTEFVEADDVFAALLAALDERARAAGARRLFGPANLLPNQSGGVVVSGYEERSFVDSPYNHAYYPRLYAGARLLATVRGRDVRPAAARPERGARRGALSLRRGTNRTRAARGATCEPAPSEDGARLRPRDAELELRAARLLHRDRRGRVCVPGGRPWAPDRREDRALPLQGRPADRVHPLHSDISTSSAT